MTEQKFFEIKRACNTAVGWSLWDLREAIEEIERLREALKQFHCCPIGMEASEKALEWEK